MVFQFHRRDFLICQVRDRWAGLAVLLCGTVWPGAAHLSEELYFSNRAFRVRELLGVEFHPDTDP